MEVILLNDVQSLGEQGAVINVSEGYARNFLFPKSLAIVACKGALKDLDARKEQLRIKAEKRYQADLANAKLIEDMGLLVLEAAVGEDGKLFGTITPKELAAIVNMKTEVVVDKRNVVLSAPITRVGEYKVSIRLSSRVTAKLTLEVVAPDDDEEESA